MAAFSKLFPLAAQLTTNNVNQLAKLIDENQRNLHYSPQGYLSKKALQESMAYIENKADSAMFFSKRDKLLKHALGKVSIDGRYLEFGVASGTTINLIAEEKPDEKIYGFDSFEGLPEDWLGYRQSKGAFSTGGKLPKVRDNVRLIKGLFADTLPEFCKHSQQPIAFLHCDVDLYSSTKCIFTHCGNMIGNGTVIVFDEFFNYPGWKQHECKAFEEFINETGLGFEFVGFALHQAAVIIKD